MGPKLVLVIALFGAAALDWLAASADRADKSPKLTLEEAEKLLKDSPSLERDEVAEVLVRLDKDLKIDGVRVGELLLSPNRNNVCDLESQEQRVSSCKLIVTESLKNYCKDLVWRIREECRGVISWNLITYVNPQMKETAKKLYSVVMDAAHKKYVKLGKPEYIRSSDDVLPTLDLKPAFESWVAQQKPEFVDSVVRECTAFHELDRKMWELFRINIRSTGYWSGTEYYYLKDAGKYCNIALEAVEKVAEEVAKEEAAKEEAAKEEAKNKQRHKSSWRMFS
jgi:hypothetical protein